VTVGEDHSPAIRSSYHEMLGAGWGKLRQEDQRTDGKLCEFGGGILALSTNRMDVD
jgi:hypothetical protein